MIAGLLLAAGGVVYILFREPVAFTRLFVNPEILPLIRLPHNLWCDALRYQASDALWCIALLTYATSLESKGLRMTFISTPLLLEFGQLTEVIPGTFDIADLCTYTVLSIIFVLKWKKRKTDSQPSGTA